MIQIYQKYISPLLHFITRSLFGPNQGCRFTPTCSEYTRQAFRKYSFLKAFCFSLFRLLRCNPFFKGGFDPLR